MDQHNPRDGQRPEPEGDPRPIPEPTTPPSPVPPVPAYRPPHTTPFRTSATGEGDPPESGGIDKSTSRPEAHRTPGRGPDAVSPPRRPAQNEQADLKAGAPPTSGAPGADRPGHAGAYGEHSQARGPSAGTSPGWEHAAFAPDEEAGGTGTAPPPGRPHPPLYNPPPPPRRKRHSITGPLILILLGLFFLGQSLGLIQWSLWDAVWRLWPVWLIVAGLDMLLGERGGWGRALVVFVAVAVIMGIVLGVQPRNAERPSGTVPPSPSRIFIEEWMDPVPTAPSLPAAEQRPEQLTIAQPLDGISAAEVRIESSLSLLRVGGGDLPDLLIQGTVRPLIGEQVQWEYDTVDDTGVFRLYSDKPTRISSGPRQGEWNLTLTDRIPVRMHLSTGVSESNIDLTRLQVPELNLDTGVGEVSLWLPEEGPVTGTIHTGIGEITLWVPGGRSARIRVETSVGRVTVYDGFQRQGEYYVTPQYAEQEDAIDLVITGGVGTVNLRIMD